MVQVGASVSYDDPMDEKLEPSWTNEIRTAIREFVEAVNDSSRQLAAASEQFVRESFQAVDEVRGQSEASAAASAEMARQAREAAEEARGATAALHSAVHDATEQVRSEVRLNAEQAETHRAQINEIGAQIKTDLQQRIDEMVARLEAGTASYREAMETAQAAKSAAEAAAERIETSVSAVEAAVALAREAAETARASAEKSHLNVDSVSLALTSAQEAAESSRRSAVLAEEAGKRSDFAAEANMLLERLETDYSLLTRLVQELHSRISSLSAVTVAAPEPVYPVVDEDSTDAALAAEEPEREAEENGSQPVSALASSYIAPAPVAPWPPQPPEGLETSASAEEPESQPGESPVVSPVPSIRIYGRVQMMISPVPDFDRLLSLDSALARINGVRTVTLADYAKEEVIFRVDVEKPVSVVEFAHQLGESAGVGTEVTEASETTLSIRIS